MNTVILSVFGGNQKISVPTEKGKTMTVAELAKVVQTSIKVMSAYNGKVLCHRFNPEKHKEIGERETDCVWADLQIVESGFGKQAKAIICCYADGTKELFEKFNETMEVGND